MRSGLARHDSALRLVTVDSEIEPIGGSEAVLLAGSPSKKPDMKALPSFGSLGSLADEGERAFIGEHELEDIAEEPTSSTPSGG